MIYQHCLRDRPIGHPCCKCFQLHVLLNILNVIPKKCLHTPSSREGDRLGKGMQMVALSTLLFCNSPFKCDYRGSILLQPLHSQGRRDLHKQEWDTSGVIAHSTLLCQPFHMCYKGTQVSEGWQIGKKDANGSHAHAGHEQDAVLGSKEKWSTFLLSSPQVTPQGKTFVTDFLPYRTNATF